MNRDKPIANLANKLQKAKLATFVMFFGYIVLDLIWHYQISPPKTDISPGVIAFIYLLPFLCLIPGLFKGWPANQGILCIVATAYFSRAVINSFHEGFQGIFAAIEAVWLAGLFVTAMLYARWQGRTYMERAKQIEDEQAASGDAA